MFRIPTLIIALTLTACAGAAPREASHHADSSATYGGAETLHLGGGEAEAPAAPTSSAPMDSAPPAAARGATARGAAPSADGAAAPRAAMAAEAAEGATVTVTVDTPTPPALVAEPMPQGTLQRLLTAASVGDHDRRGNYLEFLRRHPHVGRRLGLDMTRRIRFRVEDQQGRPVGDANIRVDTNRGEIHGRTHADGVWDFFPGVIGVGAQGQGVAHVSVHGRRVGSTQIAIPAMGDAQDIAFRVTQTQSQPPEVLDLAFLIDVTGSMEDELRYVNQEVVDIVSRIRTESPEVTVRVGAVFYRDRSDSVPLQRIHFTTDVQGFAQAMTSVRASGGGDYPEDMNAGLHTALRSMRWSEGNAARVLAVIGDAPPQRYQTQYTYVHAMQDAARMGVRILPVAASGANREVEYLFRAFGSFTSTPYVYLTDDSGVGNPHLEADTDRVAVEYFNDLLTRVVLSDLRGAGMHEPAGFDR